MLEKTYDIDLHDIKTIVEVQEYSLYYFLAISLVVFLLIGVVLYFLYRWFRNKNRYNKRKEYFKMLDTLDFNDTKKAAYAITRYAEIFKNDSEKHTELFEQILKKLEQHKYKKDVDKFDNETLKIIQEYKEIINV